MSIDDSGSDQLPVKLKQVWRRQRLSNHIGGIAVAISLMIPLVIGLFLLDRMLDLPRVARWLLLVLGMAVLVWQLRKRWFAGLESYNSLRLAARVEQFFPQLNSLLVSYVQLSQPSPGATGSNELFGVVRTQALQATSSLDFKETVNFAKLKPLLKWAGLTIVLFTIMVMLCGSSLLVAAKRYLGADISYPTATKIVNVAENQVIAEGSYLSLTVDAEGEVPAKGTILVRNEGSEEWRSIEIQRTHAGDFRYEMKHVEESFEYVFEIGDATSHSTSEPGKVTVVAPPRVSAQTLKVSPPAYTGMKPYVLGSLANTVPAHSTLSWVAKLSAPVSEVKLLGPDGWELEGQISEDAETIEFTWTASTAGLYQLHSKGKQMGLTTSGTEYRLRLREDQEPRASLVSPAGNVKATTNKNLKLAVRASDDYGLSEFAILYRLNGSDTQHRVPLGAPPSNDAQQDLQHPRSGTWPLQWKIAADIPQLVSGDVLEVAVEVTEVAADPAGARKVITQTCEVEILSLADYQAHITSRFDALRGEIAETERRELLIKHAIDASKNKNQK